MHKAMAWSCYALIAALPVLPVPPVPVVPVPVPVPVGGVAACIPFISIGAYLIA